MPISQHTVESLIRGCMERTVAPRYAGQEIPFEKAADLTELKIALINNVVLTIKREMGVLPGQTSAEPPFEPIRAPEHEDPPIPESLYEVRDGQA